MNLHDVDENTQLLVRTRLAWREVTSATSVDNAIRATMKYMQVRDALHMQYDDVADDYKAVLTVTEEVWKRSK